MCTYKTVSVQRNLWLCVRQENDELEVIVKQLGISVSSGNWNPGRGHLAQ